jgi:imidazolonepropionase
MLRAIQQASAQTAADLISTCLAAHLCPKDWKGSPSDYLNEIASQLFPVLLAEKLCHRIDAFVEKSAFSPEEIIPYLEKAKELGFDLTIHADQFSCGGSQLAVALGAHSADHLEASGEVEIIFSLWKEIVAKNITERARSRSANIQPAKKFAEVL